METIKSHPTTAKQRIESLDVLRGFAILGILVVNIQSFAMPAAAYLNPTAYGDMNGINKWVWLCTHILADQKFMTIFSILFGAGIVLMTQKAEARTGSSRGLHYRRTFWLLIIGLIHAHLIWHGDILVPYALCAFIIYALRKKPPRMLLVIGMLAIAVHTLLYVGIGSTIQHWPPESYAAAKVSWLPSELTISEEIEAVTGNLSQQLAHNSQSAFFLETAVFLFLFLWRAGGLMLVGMALYKWGILSASRSSIFYARSMFIGWLIGFPIVVLGVQANSEAEWSLAYSMYFGSQFNYWGSLLISLGYICGVMLFVQSAIFPWLRSRLAAVGQMALSNYIMQSVFCVFIFWGTGLGLFGSVERRNQILIVFAIWLLQLLWSKPWLQRFQFGPLEWIWRSFSYQEWQPWKR